MEGIAFIGVCIFALYLLGRCAHPKENIPIYDQKYIEYERRLMLETSSQSYASSLELQNDIST
jgi:hypothetical protein